LRVSGSGMVMEPKAQVRPAKGAEARSVECLVGYAPRQS